MNIEEFEVNVSGDEAPQINDEIVVAEEQHSERGTAIVLALLIMILLMGFVALAVSRTSNETVAASNDAAESRAFDAAHASLEVMTRNFNKIFETKLNPDAADLTRIRSQAPPDFDDYDFTGQDIQITDEKSTVVMTEGQFQGLTAIRDGWHLTAPVIDRNTGVRVTLSRRFFNNRIPIFQFGIFYDDDLEFHPGPRFDFGGRVHSNGSLFLSASNRLNFSSKVTAAKHVFTDVQKNNTPWTNWSDQVYIKNASGVYQRLSHDMGSVLQSPSNGPVVTTADEPSAYANANWPADEAVFQGNLLADQKPLNLPLKLNSDITGTQLDLIELVKRGKSVGDLANVGGDGNARDIQQVAAGSGDDVVTASERYYNKTGFRVLLADARDLLPGCETVPLTDPCGIRLDGAHDGQGADADGDGSKGYQPLAMSDGYKATRINGERLAAGVHKIPTPGQPVANDRDSQVWIKIETIQYNPATLVYDTNDITEDVLSLGVTEQAPAGVLDAPYTTGADGTDGRSIIKLQRFVVPGIAIQPANSPYITQVGSDNYVSPITVAAGNNCKTDTILLPIDSAFTDNRAHMLGSSVNSVPLVAKGCIVPFPIEMFDTREGLYNDTNAVFNPKNHYKIGGNPRVPVAGIMSMVDIDINNLRRLWLGNFDASMPTGTPYYNKTSQKLKGKCDQIPAVTCDIPSSNGWVMYLSDRRGDYDFDGRYDMEDVYGPNDGTLQVGEDMQKSAGQLGYGTLQADYGREAEKYRCPNNPCQAGDPQSVSPDNAMVVDHKYYRRGIRLINGRQLPGIYSSATPSDTKGFTVASENGVYVQGNYNASGVASYGTPTPSTDYLPIGSADVPASVAADAITILSNAWQDSLSFRYPFDMTNRNASETYHRYAILTGDTLSSLGGTPNQGGGDPRLSGGVHNFKRFLEDWGGVRMNYSGSLINLFNSQNNNGPFKCCTNDYSPPQRNWVFDTTFLDINRIPPGTPFFQVIQITGFERRN